jgi:potassium-transporting ATPase KdpC subunit
MKEIRTAAIAVIALTLVLGLAYPLAMTGVSQVLMPKRADGEAKLIGRDFSKHLDDFQSRPSATGYDAGGTYFNNLGPNQKALADLLKKNLAAYVARERRYTPGLKGSQVPPDAVTTSASGVDPDISEANADIQANRIAARRNLSRARVLRLIEDHSSRPLFGLAGPRSVNVLELNLALDKEASR